MEQLVIRHADLVYGTALRIVNGDAHLAQDVAQMVFIHMARNAWKLPEDVVLAGWLHRHTTFTACAALRSDQRRKAREQRAMEMSALEVNSENAESRWDEVAPHLDAALNELKSPERDAIVLRFLKQQDFRSLGTALGISEDAAQKRVSRALDKLRSILANRGVSITSAGLAAMLLTNTASAVPAGLVAGITAQTMAATAKSGTLIGVLKIMASIKVKTGVVSAVVIACMIVPLMVEREAQTTLRHRSEQAAANSNQLAQLRAEVQRLAELSSKPTVPPPGQSIELLRRRDEVGRLMVKMRELSPSMEPQTQEEQLEILKEYYSGKANRLRDWMNSHPSEKIPELEHCSQDDFLSSAADSELETDEEFSVAMANMRANSQSHILGTLGSAWRRYAKENNGQNPPDLSALKPYFRSPIDEAILERYEFVQTSQLVPELRSVGDWAITEKAPVNEKLDIRNVRGLKGGTMADVRITNRWTFRP